MKKYDQAKFNKFKEEVLKYDTIKIDELYILINRLTWANKKTYWGFNNHQKSNSRLRYHRYWIKMLEGMGIIEQIPNMIQQWKVIK